MKQIKILLLSCFLNLLLTYKLSCASDISDASDVCTIEGLFSLTGTASSAISPTFSLAQELVEVTADTLARMYAHDDVSFSFTFNDDMTLITSGANLGAACDQRTTRTLEAWALTDFMAPKALTAETGCSCYTDWENWCLSYPAFYGVYCTNCTEFCFAQAVLDLGQNLEDLIPSQYDLENMIQFYYFGTYNYGRVWAPPNGAFSSGSQSVFTKFLQSPDEGPPYIDITNPENNPTKETLWTEAYVYAYSTTNTDLWVSVGAPVYIFNQYYGSVMLDISLNTTLEIFNELTPTASGFSMLLDLEGHVLGTSAAGYEALFGNSYDLSSDELPYIFNASGGDFSDFFSQIDLPGYDTVTLNGEDWIFTREPTQSVPWVVSLASPTNEVVNAAAMTISPPTVTAVVDSSKAQFEFDMDIENTGYVPINVFLSKSATVALGLTGNLTLWFAVLSPNEHLPVHFIYDGHEYPFKGDIQVLSTDAVTDFGFCFKETQYLSVSASVSKIYQFSSRLKSKGTKSKTGMIAGLAVGLPFFAILVITSAILLACIKRLHRKVKILQSQLEGNQADMLDTPAGKAIEVLNMIKKKTRLTHGDKDSLEYIVSLIASDSLHKTDYVSRKKAGRIRSFFALVRIIFAELDSEIDRYLMTNILTSSPSLNDHRASVYLASADHLEASNTIIDEWEFSAISYNQDTVLVDVATAVFNRHQLLDKFKIDKELFSNWIQMVAKSYFQNPYMHQLLFLIQIRYHSSVHAADVVQAVNYILLQYGPNKFSDLTLLAFFFAACIHDLQHPGVNNNLLLQSFDPLVVRFNGVSVLESMHVSEAFQQILHGKTNWLAVLTKAQLIEFHRLVVQFVLATDMARHVELLSQFSSKCNAGSFDLTQSSDIVLLLQAFLKIADISNPLRQWSDSEKWAEAVMQEFFLQGDQEKRLGLPISPFMDRATAKVAKCQSAFIKFVVTPLSDAVVKFLPGLQKLVKYREENVIHWKEREDLESPRKTTAIISNSLAASSKENA